MSRTKSKPARDAGSRAGGDCYQAAAHLFMSLGAGSGAVLVHGDVTGQGVIAGERYGHAWLEVGGTVIDPSNQRTVVMLREAYYALGDIDAGAMRRYSWQEGVGRMALHGHYGPWPEDEP